MALHPFFSQLLPSIFLFIAKSGKSLNHENDNVVLKFEKESHLEIK